MANYDTEVRIHSRVDNKDLTKLDIQISKTKDKVEQLAKKMNEFGSKKLPTKEYDEVQKQLKKTEERLNKLLEKKEKYKGSKKAASWLNMNEEIEELQRSLPYLNGELSELEDTGKAFTLGKDTDEYNKLTKQYKYANEELRLLLERREQINRTAEAKGDKDMVRLLERQVELEDKIRSLKEKINSGEGTRKNRKELKSTQKELKNCMNQIGREAKKGEKAVDKMASTSSKALKRMGGESKKSGGLISTIGTRLQGLALSLLIFNWISKGFNAMVQCMQKGFQNLAKSSSEYNRNMSEMKASSEQLQNGLAAAFEPIVNLALPMLTALINRLNAATEQMAKFIAMISGKSSYKRAIKNVKDYADTLDNTQKSIKGVLASFDTLEVLDTSSAGESSSGSMFEDVALDDADLSQFEMLTAIVGDIKAKAEELRDIFMDNFLGSLTDFEDRINIVKTALQGIKDALIHIWSDDDVISACDTWAQSLAGLLGSYCGMLASIGITMAANLLGGLEQYLNDNVERIQSYIISMFDVWSQINNQLAAFFSAFAYIFSVFASEEGIALTAAFIGIFTDAFMGCTEICSKMVRGLVTLITQPFIDNKDGLRGGLEEMLGAVANVLQNIKDAVDELVDGLNQTYDDYVKPLIDIIVGDLSEWVGIVIEFFRDELIPLIDEFGDMLGTYMMPIIDEIILILQDIITILTELWVHVLQPLLDWLLKIFLAGLKNLFRQTIDNTRSILTVVTNVLQAIEKILRGFMTFFSGVFSGNIEKTVEGLKMIFEGLKHFVAGVVNAIIGLAEGMANGVVDAINLVIKALNALSFDVPDWVPGIGGKSWGFNLKELSRVSIPRVALADGGITMGPTRALIGEAGQEAVLPLENNTGWMDTLADKIAGRMPAGGTGTVILELDGAEVARAELPYLRDEQTRIGTDYSMV